MFENYISFKFNWRIYFKIIFHFQKVTSAVCSKRKICNIKHYHLSRSRMSKFKTKSEYEEEDSISHQRRLEKLQKRRDLKRAEGFKCKFEGCEEQFEAKLDFDAHVKKHQNECFKAMKCTKSECKDLKVIFQMFAVWFVD